MFGVSFNSGDWQLNKGAALTIIELNRRGVYGPSKPPVCGAGCVMGLPYINGKLDIRGAVAVLVTNAQNRCAAVGLPLTCYSGYLLCGGKKKDISCGWNESQPDSWSFSCGGRSILGTVCFDRNYFFASRDGSKLAGWVKTAVMSECGQGIAAGLVAGALITGSVTSGAVFIQSGAIVTTSVGAAATSGAAIGAYALAPVPSSTITNIGSYTYDAIVGVEKCW